MRNATYLVIGQESGLVGEVAGDSAAGCWRTDVEFVLVHQREGSTVRRHTDHELLLRCSLLHPFPRAVILQRERDDNVRRGPRGERARVSLI